jgi:acyl-CoA synthetase (AMP-forming)/AMP-acid ligase II
VVVLVRPLAYDFALLMPDVFAHNARIHGNRIAVVCDEERITWREADARTNRFANLLKARGLSTGDKVALFMPASLDAWVAFWGAVKAGCVAVPLNVLLDMDALARLAANSDAVVMVADTGTEERLDTVRDRLPAVQHWLSFGAGAGWDSARDEIAAASPEPCGVAIKPDDIITILYTSGSTGEPKGIEHTHASRMAYPYGFGIGIKVDRYSVAVLGTPPYASGTWITMAPIMYTGGTLVILRSFSAEAWLSAVERERATHAFLVPTQFIAILQHEKLSSFDVSSMRALVTAGQPMAEKTYDGLVAAFPNAGGVYEVYGFSEGFATLRTPEDAAHGKRHTVGTSLFLDDIRIIDENLVELPRGETGEIVANALMMMTGYYKNPARTEETTWVAPDGRTFMRTGDVGRIDDDGFVYVSGRLKDMLKSGGHNIFAIDIEEVFMRHPEVSECAAIAEPHEKWGETPVLVVLLAPGGSVDAETLRAWGNSHLAKYQRVSRVEIREELPRAVYGKIAKHELRAEFARKAQP